MSDEPKRGSQRLREGLRELSERFGNSLEKARQLAEAAERLTRITGGSTVDARRGLPRIAPNGSARRKGGRLRWMEWS
jgi:hypothetical protein